MLTLHEAILNTTIFIDDQIKNANNRALLRVQS